jgi:hypothetical protein
MGAFWIFAYFCPSSFKTSFPASYILLLMQLQLKNNIAVSDSGFIFNPTSGDSYSTNPIGAEILGMLKDAKEKEEIRQYILDTYNTDEDTFEKDYYDFVNLLMKFKLVDDGSTDSFKKEAS